MYIFIPSSAETEMFDDVKNLYGFLDGSVIGLLGYDEVNVDVGMNKVTICGTSYRTLDTHQTVLLRSLQHCLTVQIFAVTRIIDVRADPADILATAETPLAKTKSSHI